ncbi:MAG: hypothetical protein ACRDH0_08840, partial [Actinomycetota bacterium]
MRTFELFVVLPTLLGISLLLAREQKDLGQLKPFELAVWIGIIAVVELLPVPVWRGVQIGMGFPLLMAVAFLYQPPEAALAALLGTSDLREFRRQLTVLRALFNRCQVSIAVLAASAVFHSLISIRTSSAFPLVAAAMLAAIVDYLVNNGLVAVYLSIKYAMSPTKVIRQLRIGPFAEYIISYLGLAVFGLILAKLFPEVSFWVVLGYVPPL